MNPHFQLQSSRSVRGFDFFWSFFQSLRTGAGTVFIPNRRIFPFGLRPSAFARISAFVPVLFLFAAAETAFAETNSITPPPFPYAAGSLIRVTGALALVLGLFLGGVWLFKNWQRLSLQHGHRPKLNILETRSLGARQAIFVVGYERQRFLVATSPAGVNLVSHLPDAEAGEPETPEKPGGPMPFSQALAQVLKRK